MVPFRVRLRSLQLVLFHIFGALGVFLITPLGGDRGHFESATG